MGCLWWQLGYPIVGLQSNPSRKLHWTNLRGIFMLRHKELRWFYQEGASYLFPDAGPSNRFPLNVTICGLLQTLDQSRLQTRLEQPVPGQSGSSTSRLLLTQN